MLSTSYVRCIACLVYKPLFFSNCGIGNRSKREGSGIFSCPPLSFLPFAWEGLWVKYMINQNRPQFYSPLYSLLEQRAYIFTSFRIQNDKLQIFRMECRKSKRQCSGWRSVFYHSLVCIINPTVHVYIIDIVGSGKKFSNSQLLIVILWIPNILPSRPYILATKHHIYVQPIRIIV